MLGVVACETLYNEFDRRSREVAVEYIPQWYHEYPIHAPESRRINAMIQDRIDDLESQGVDEILLLYHDPEGVAGVATDGVPVHVFEGGDCIELFLTDSPKGRFGERKAASTYYLTRGWIDVGIDCYKVYRGYAGEIRSEIDRFERAQADHPDMWVRWPESERIASASKRSGSMGVDPGALLNPIVSCYHRVLLVDTGTLHPFHHEYAESVRAFVAEAGSDDEAERKVPLRVIAGDTSRFERLLAEPDAVEEVRTYPAGTPVSKPDVHPFPPSLETD